MTKRTDFLTILLMLLCCVLFSFFEKTFIFAALFFAWVLLFWALLHPYVKVTKRLALTFVAGALLGNLFILIFTHFQNFIPFWDYAGYWQEAVKNQILFYSSPHDWFVTLYESMLYSDYTRVPVQLFAPIIKLFGASFNLYVACIYNLYILPFTFLFLCLLSQISKKALSSALFIPVFFFAPVLTPALYGYLDSVGLMFIAALLIIFYKRDFYRFSFWENILLSILLVFFIFTRRWYLFFIVSLFFAAGMLCLVRAIKDRTTRKKEGVYLLNLASVAVMTLCIIAVFFFPYLARLFTNNLSDTYSAYQFGNPLWNVNYFISYYGYLPFILSVCGFVRGILHKPTRQFSAMLGICSVASFILFTRMQTISYHHQYVFVPTILLFICFLIILPYRNNRNRRICSSVIIAVLLLSFFLTYVPAFEPVARFLSPVFSAKQMYPKTNENAAIVREIADYLNELTENTDDHAYILSSSEAFNDDMLQNSAMPARTVAVPNLFSTAHVDKRDGFPNVLLVAKYVVVADPVQLHLNGGGQEIVAYLAEQITNGAATNLVPIRTFSLAPYITVTVYERTGGYDLSFLENIKAHFTALYPEYENLTNIDMVFSQND